METNTPQIQNKPKFAPGEFFLHLGITAALYTSAVSLIALFFSLINYSYPIKGLYYGPFTNGIKGALATLIIAFIAYILLAWLAQRSGDTEVIRPVRKWMAYLTLFVTGAAIATDLIVLLMYFIDGDYTLRFFLKVLVVLVVAGSVFKYYFFDLRKNFLIKTRRILAVVAGVVVLVAIVWAFTIIGSPARQRDLKLDSRRVSDLSTIQGNISYYWQRKAALPKDLSALKDPLLNVAVPVDPETGASYEYMVKGDRAFTLCATFAEPSPADAQQYRNGSYAVEYPGMSFAPENWSHGKGRVCFDRTIDPELYPTMKDGIPVRPR